MLVHLSVSPCRLSCSCQGVCQQTFDDAYNPLVETKDSTAATAAAVTLFIQARIASQVTHHFLQALIDMTAAIAVYDAQFETHLDVDTRRAQVLEPNKPS